MVLRRCLILSGLSRYLAANTRLLWTRSINTPIGRQECHCESGGQIWYYSVINTAHVCVVELDDWFLHDAVRFSNKLFAWCFKYWLCLNIYRVLVRFHTKYNTYNALSLYLSRVIQVCKIRRVLSRQKKRGNNFVYLWQTQHVLTWPL